MVKKLYQYLWIVSQSEHRGRGGERQRGRETTLLNYSNTSTNTNL